MIRLILPLASGALFFLLSLVTVRVARPRTPRLFFLTYAALSLAAVAAAYVWRWPIRQVDDALGLLACMLLHILICLTAWNMFYSLLWGFSGGLCHDLLHDARLRRLDQLVRSYEREEGLDRMLARRVPNLVAGGYLTFRDNTMQLLPRGRAIARGTLAAFKLFSLGMGGGTN